MEGTMKSLQGTVSGLLTAGFIGFLSFGHPAFAEQVSRQQILEALTAQGRELLGPAAAHAVDDVQ
jgi:hypothetical protein